MGVGAGLYMCDVVKKSSRSLSHLLMSSCFYIWKTCWVKFQIAPYSMHHLLGVINDSLHWLHVCLSVLNDLIFYLSCHLFYSLHGMLGLHILQAGIQPTLDRYAEAFL